MMNRIYSAVIGYTFTFGVEFVLFLEDLGKAFILGIAGALGALLVNEVWQWLKKYKSKK